VCLAGSAASVWKEVIRVYEEERDQAADEIQRLRDANENLCDQISVLHATGEENYYSQFERIRELEEVLEDMLRAFSRPIRDQSGEGALHTKVCEVLNRARALLHPAGESSKAYCLH
jgi:hypothetical protein